MYTDINPYPNYLYHHGVKGMKWGIRKDPERQLQRIAARNQKNKMRARAKINKVQARRRKAISRGYIGVLGVSAVKGAIAAGAYKTSMAVLSNPANSACIDLGAATVAAMSTFYSGINIGQTIMDLGTVYKADKDRRMKEYGYK